MDDKPQVTRMALLDMQVCVPSDWTDDQITKFANRENVCGTSLGWCITRQGDKFLSGCDERVKCLKRDGFVHIMLHA